MNDPENSIIIAIDGYSSCGKSTFAKAIARRLNYIYIDSGAMYRAVTLYALRHEIISGDKVDNEKLLSHLNRIKIDIRNNPKMERNDIYLNDENVEEEIRTIDVSNHVSEISKIKSVRNKMVELQREMGKTKGIVMDGRDIGTVVFPNAEIKIFMTADADIRAERRYKELAEKGMKVSFEEVRENIMKRDRIDENREVSPLQKAEDAITLDNSNMTPEDQMVWFDELLIGRGFYES
jgi:cytidylate kinase